MVGLFIPGSILIIASSLSFGAFSKIYLLSLPFKTDFNRNCNVLIKAWFSSEITGDVAKTASEVNSVSISLSPFLNNVLPLETISQIPSARPIFGAISTEPLMICKLA